MTSDYPDWQRAFRIVASDVTIPINIESSTITLNVAIASAAVTLDINIAAAAVDLNIVFTDQSVAVFDAAKWFAHQAQQIFVSASGYVSNGVPTLVASRLVPAGRTFFVTGFGYGVWTVVAIPDSMLGDLEYDSTPLVYLGSKVGTPIIFDTPIRLTAGQTAKLYLLWNGPSGSLFCYASFWGYDEVV